MYVLFGQTLNDTPLYAKIADTVAEAHASSQEMLVSSPSEPYAQARVIWTVWISRHLGHSSDLVHMCMQ